MKNVNKTSPACCPNCMSALDSTSPIQKVAINHRQPLLNTLFEADTSISIDCGQIVIVSQNGLQTTKLQQDLNSQLTKELLELLQIEAFVYTSYSVGVYDKKFPGLTLQFLSETSGESYYTIFNVEITRKRTTRSGKKGELLPAGHFHVGKRSLFYYFWHSTALAYPARLSSFHDYLGNLGKILFSAEKVPDRPGRLGKTSLRPLSVPAEVIRRRFLADNDRTISGHGPDNEQTSVPDNTRAQGQLEQAIQSDTATCAENYDKQVIRGREYEGARTPCQHKRPEEQTEKEWLADFCSPPAAGN
ncbi:hypothetical protein [Stutzerimonas stutzeri]|uniref:hypothetical protein n=1 Tax=Stutzerimonas stutzeri TaxID=316 RepID=UPI0015E44BBE|nr:hypothetical protein [Stutzerimonas stutzeri]MBA1265315.1 hypothetical protein [Stutzerimonas stutzeri]